MQLFIFSVCKFFPDEVQFSMGFLACPVTADHTCHHAGYNKYTDDYNSSLYHTSVPLILPSTMLIAMAEMNMPVSMYTRSMLEHVYAQPGTDGYDYYPEIKRSHTSIYATDVVLDRAVSTGL